MTDVAEKTGTETRSAIGETNFDNLYKEFGKDLRDATNKWYLKLKVFSQFKGDWLTLKSIVDEVFLSCVRNWNMDRQNNCKFRSFLFTQLNRRLLNELLYANRRIRKQRKNHLEFISVDEIAFNFFSASLPFDYNLEDDVISDFTEMIPGGGIDPERVCMIKDCVERVKLKSSRFKEVLECLEDLTTNEHDTQQMNPNFMAEVYNRCHLTRAGLQKVFKRLRVEIETILQGD